MHLSSWRRLIDRNFDDVIRIVITMMLIIIVIGRVENNRFLLLYFSSDTSLDIAIGILKLVIVIASEKVGRIRVYKLTPSMPIVLVIIIFINRPNNLVMKPPIIRIIVDVINFSFIVYIYVKEIKKEEKSLLSFFK